MAFTNPALDRLDYACLHCQWRSIAGDLSKQASHQRAEQGLQGRHADLNMRRAAGTSLIVLLLCIRSDSESAATAVHATSDDKRRACFIHGCVWCRSNCIRYLQIPSVAIASRHTSCTRVSVLKPCLGNTICISITSTGSSSKEWCGSDGHDDCRVAPMRRGGDRVGSVNSSLNSMPT